MKKMSRVERKLRKYSCADWYKAAYAHWRDPNRVGQLQVLEGTACVRHLAETGKSFLRWGDGETMIVYRNDIRFERYSETLRRELLGIMADHADRSDLMLGLPQMFTGGSWQEFREQSDNRPRIWKETRRLLSRHCKPTVAYGDAFLFRPASDLSNEDFLPIWQGGSLVVVSSDPAHQDSVDRLFSPTWSSHVKVPAREAYAQIDEAEQACRRAQAEAGESADVTFLLSAGPAGKALGNRLALAGHRVHDVGNYFTWKLLGRPNEKGA